MARRNIYFKLDDSQIETDFGNWIMLLIFSKSINIQKFKILKNYNRSANIFSDEVQFNELELKICIDFISELIVKLNDTEELHVLYSEDNLMDILNIDEDFSYIILNKNDTLLQDNAVNVEWLKNLRDKIFIQSLNLRKSHLVYVE